MAEEPELEVYTERILKNWMRRATCEVQRASKTDGNEFNRKDDAQNSTRSFQNLIRIQLHWKETEPRDISAEMILI